MSRGIIARPSACSSTGWPVAKGCKVIPACAHLLSWQEIKVADTSGSSDRDSSNQACNKGTRSHRLRPLSRLARHLDRLRGRVGLDLFRGLLRAPGGRPPSRCACGEAAAPLGARCAPKKATPHLQHVLCPHAGHWRPRVSMAFQRMCTGTLRWQRRCHCRAKQFVFPTCSFPSTECCEVVPADGQGKHLGAAPAGVTRRQHPPGASAPSRGGSAGVALVLTSFQTLNATLTQQINLEFQKPYIPQKSAWQWNNP